MHLEVDPVFQIRLLDLHCMQLVSERMTSSKDFIQQPATSINVRLSSSHWALLLSVHLRQLDMSHVYVIGNIVKSIGHTLDHPGFAFLMQKILSFQTFVPKSMFVFLFK